MDIIEYTSRVAKLAAPLNNEVKERYTLGVEMKLKALQEKIAPLIAEVDAIKKYLFYGKNKENLLFSGPQLSTSDEDLGILHAQLGVITEAIEFWETDRKDKAHLIEESFDGVWYHCYGCHVLNINPEEGLDMNIEKLEKKRYAKGFTPQQAINRDLNNEATTFNSLK